SIIAATSTGRPMRPTSSALRRTRAPRPAQGRRRREGRQRTAPGSRQLRTLWPPSAHTLRGRNSAPGYHCSGEHLVEGRGSYCLHIGGVQIDDAVARAFIAALEPAKIAATLAAAEQLEIDREAALKHWRLGVERASYVASLAERRYRAVDPDNRLVALGLERAWEESLRAAGGGGSADGRRQRRTGRAGGGLPGLAEPGARAGTAARHGDEVRRDAHT